MPTLHWTGKEKVIHHHLDVPHRVLNHKYGFTATDGQTTTPTHSGNKIIHGDNLEALKALLPEYEGRVKCIYIDPPYNTGNEFIYPDNYTENLQTYLEYTGQVDSEGRKSGTNTDTDGRFHSKWMNMMYPRLFLAKNLLRTLNLLIKQIFTSASM